MTIPNEDLAAIRSEAEQFFPQTALIRRRTVASDGRGGQTEDWFDLAANVPGRLESGAGTESTVGERRTAVQNWTWKCPHGQDLRETDLLVIDGQFYDVDAVTRKPFGAYTIASVTLTKDPGQ